MKKNHSSIAKIIIILSLIIFSSATSYSQIMYFCESVDDNGYPVSQSTVFTISPEGGYLDVLVRVRGELNSDFVNFDTFHVIDGVETYETTSKMDAEINWTFFWKQFTFYKEGTYRIYVYDDEDLQIAFGTVTVKF